MRKSINASKVKINFKQPDGLHVIAFMIFCLCLCVTPFISVLNQHGDIDFFYNRNNNVFVIFFAGVFGCASNYIFGSTKSIVHGLQFIIIALILSLIKNFSLFGDALLWVGLAIVIVNLLFNLSSFYLKTDLRRLYGFIAIYSSALLGMAIGVILHFLVLTDMHYFKVLYLFVVIFLLNFFLKNSYKLNTSLTNQTQRVDISFYGIFIIFFVFAFIVFYLLLNLRVFSFLALAIFPICLIYLHILTVSNNKENGIQLLKYVYFSLALMVINKTVYLGFLKYQNSINPEFLNYPISIFALLLIGYIFCMIVYIFDWRFKVIILKVESITGYHLIKTILCIEIVKILILIISVIITSKLIDDVMLTLTTILSIILSIFIVPMYFCLGKILAGGKNEITTTTLLYLIFSSLIFISFLHDFYIDV